MRRANSSRYQPIVRVCPCYRRCRVSSIFTKIFSAHSAFFAAHSQDGEFTAEIHTTRIAPPAAQYADAPKRASFWRNLPQTSWRAHDRGSHYLRIAVDRIDPVGLAADVHWWYNMEHEK